MVNFSKMLLLIDSGSLNSEQLLSILILTVSNIEINTISEMARLEGKTPRGIRISKKYRKVKIGSQTMCVKGLSDNNMPF